MNILAEDSGSPVVSANIGAARPLLEANRLKSAAKAPKEGRQAWSVTYPGRRTVGRALRLTTPRVRTETPDCRSSASAVSSRSERRGAKRIFLVPSGDNFEAVLGFCRALRRAGVPPAILAAGADDPIFRTDFARYVVHIRARQEYALDDFAAGIRSALLRSGAGRCVLAPTAGALVTWAMLYRPGLAQLGCDLPLPYESVYERVREPELFAEFCRKRGLAVAAPDASGPSFTLMLHLPRVGRWIAYSQEDRGSAAKGGRAILTRAASLHRRGDVRRWAELLAAAGFEGLVAIDVRAKGEELALVQATPRLWDSLELCLEGCPALLMSYIAHHTGTKPLPSAWRPSRRHPELQWTRGNESGRCALVRPTKPSPVKLLPAWSADIYFRADSWWQYLCGSVLRFGQGD